MDNVLIFFLLRRKLDDTILIIIKRHTPELRMNPFYVPICAELQRF